MKVKVQTKAKDALKADMKKKALEAMKKMKTSAVYKDSEEWPTGTKVRITDESLGQVHCGKEYVVVGQFDNGQLRLADHKAASLRCDPSSICRLEALTPVTKLQGLVSFTNEERLEILLCAGWNGSQTVKEWEAFVQETKSTTPWRAWNGHVWMYSRYLLWALQVDPSVCSILEPELTLTWIQAQIDLEDQYSEETVQELKNLEAAMKRGLSGKELVLCPLWAANGGGGAEHWTLLSLNFKDHQVWYRDTLKIQADGNSRTARQVLELAHTIDEDMPLEVPMRKNLVQQEPLQCGLYVMAYLEEDIRVALGQGEKASGWPKPAEVQARLRALLLNLQPEYKKLQGFQADHESVEVAIHCMMEGPDCGMGFKADLEEQLKLMEEFSKAKVEEGGAVVVEEKPLEGKDLQKWAEEVLQELTPGHQERCLKVKATGLGVCSTCHWLTGCALCDFGKAVRYWRDKEAKGLYKEGYKVSAKAKAKAKGKPKGKSKAKAKAKAPSGPGKVSGGGEVQAHNRRYTLTIEDILCQ